MLKIKTLHYNKTHAAVIMNHSSSELEIQYSPGLYDARFSSETQLFPRPRIRISVYADH